jgi:cytochrome b6-f complex iron-sulfur subunit
MSDLSRRDFVKFATRTLLAASGLLGFGAFLRFLDHPTHPAQLTEFNLGPATDYPLGTRKLLPDIPALLSHTEAGFTAVSLVCTHLGCTLGETADGFNCACHGSQFTFDGTARRGPAEKPLDSLSVKQTADGYLILYRV